MAASYFIATRKSTGETTVLRTSDVRLAQKQYIELRRAEIEAALTDGRKVNTPNVKQLDDGGAYELAEVNFSGATRIVRRFDLSVSYYKPISAASREYADGTLADWQSGKFHR